MPRLRPRFSLLTALLLMTIVGMAIVIARLWRGVGPLHEQVRRMRAELGYLNVDDPTQAYAIALPTDEPRHWKWRIYLPPGLNYRKLCYSGTLPSPQEYSSKAWCERVENGSVGKGGSGPIDGGECTIEAKLEKDADHWVLRTSGTGGRGASTFSLTQHSGDWLSEPEGFASSNALNSRTQTVFAPGEPIILLKVLKPIITKFPGGYSMRDPQGAAEGFVLWIEQPPLEQPLGNAPP
jgi:hypothetical protein